LLYYKGKNKTVTGEGRREVYRIYRSEKLTAPHSRMQENKEWGECGLLSRKV